MTPAHFAAHCGHADCLRALHGMRVSLSVPNVDGLTPAHFAALNGHAGRLWALLELGAKASLSAMGTCGTAPVFLASMNGHVAAVKMLCTAGVNTNLCIVPDAEGRVHDLDGSTPIHIASAHGHAHILQVLLTCNDGLPPPAAGVSPRVPKYDANMPLHIAAENGQLACVKVLAEIYPAPDTWQMFLLGGGAASELASYRELPADTTDGPRRNHLPRLYSKKDMIEEVYTYLHKPRYVDDIAQVDRKGRTALQAAEAALQATQAGGEDETEMVEVPGTEEALTQVTALLRSLM